MDKMFDCIIWKNWFDLCICNLRTVRPDKTFDILIETETLTEKIAQVSRKLLRVSYQDTFNIILTQVHPQTRHAAKPAVLVVKARKSVHYCLDLESKARGTQN